MGEIMMVGSQKNGIGKTVIGIKIGIELSKKGKNVILIDLSSGSIKMSEYLKVNEDIIYDVKDVLDETCQVEQALINVKENLCLLPHPRISEKLGNIQKQPFKKLIKESKEKYDITLIDLDFESFYLCFDEIKSLIIVNNNDFSSIKEINNLLLISKEFKAENNFVVINKFNKKESKKGNMLNQSDIKKMIQNNNAGIIELDSLYKDLDYNYLLNEQINSFNNVIKSIVNKVV